MIISTFYNQYRFIFPTFESAANETVSNIGDHADCFFDIIWVGLNLYNRLYKERVNVQIRANSSYLS